VAHQIEIWHDVANLYVTVGILDQAEVITPISISDVISFRASIHESRLDHDLEVHVFFLSYLDFVAAY
jgi:hypothetical protein